VSTHFVYLGGGFTITAFNFDPTSGASSSVGLFATTGVLNPGALAVSPDANYLIATSAQIRDRAIAGADELDVYSIDRNTGALSPVYKSPGLTGHVVCAKSYLVLDSVAGFLSYSMNSAGQLSVVSSSKQQIGAGTGTIYDSVNQVIWDAPASPDGAFVQASRVDDSGKVTTVMATNTCESTSQGNVCEFLDALAISRDGRYLFGSDSNGNVLAYRINSDLSVAPLHSYHPVQFSSASAVTMDQSGNFLYSIIEGEIVSWKVDRSSGSLTVVQHTNFSPGLGNGLQVDSSNQWLFANSISANGGVTTFKLQPDGTVQLLASPKDSSQGAVVSVAF
jgi:6-phosphogluconolactonase (cycloisomerase 2 family)